MKLPKDCPAFVYWGEVYIGRPYLGAETRTVIEVGPGITLVNSGEDYPAVLPHMHEGKIYPLTPAAQELLDWSKQS